MADRFDAQEISDALARKGAARSCPSCGHGQFNLLPGHVTMTLSDEPGKLAAGGRVLPAVGISCANCGFIALHAASTLGLL
jgi:ribosomal protein S27AE